MGRTGGYYSSGKFVKATPEELAGRKTHRELRKKAFASDASLREGGIKEFGGWGGRTELELWDGTTRNPSLWQGGELTSGQQGLVDSAKKALGIKVMTPSNQLKVGRLLDLAKSRHLQMEGYQYAKSRGFLGKGHRSHPGSDYTQRKNRGTSQGPRTASSKPKGGYKVTKSKGKGKGGGGRKGGSGSGGSSSGRDVFGGSKSFDDYMKGYDPNKEY